jgi:hypothetical protein
MVANPEVKDVTAFYDGSSTTMMALVTNTGSHGYAQIQFRQGTNNSLGALQTCLDTKISPWVYLIGFVKPGVVQSIDFVYGYACPTSAENCTPTPPTCSSPNHNSTFNTGGISPINLNPTMPSAPGDLVVIPGNGMLNVSWNAVSDPSGMSEVFAYHVKVNSGNTTILSEYVSVSTKNITIPNLTNGVTYSIEVFGLSHSKISGVPSTMTGTPTSSSSTGSINLVSVPAGAEIFLDNSDQQHVTPFTINNIPVGTHSYRLKLANYPDITGTVPVLANQTAQVSANFITGQVNVGAIVGGVILSAIAIAGLYYILKKPETTANIVNR